MVQTVNRGLLWISLALALVGTLGSAFCATLGLEVHARAMIVAGAICLVADVMAMIPLMMVRGSDQLAISQTALIGTVIQMMLTLMAGAALVLSKVGFGMDLVFWLLSFYLVSLAILVAHFVVAVKKAPITVLPARG